MKSCKRRADFETKCIKYLEPAGSAAFELIGGIASSPNARSAVEVSLSPCVNRRYGSVYKALQRAQIDEQLLRLEEEEVPRESIVVRRALQYARRLNGRTCMWMGRSKIAGRGEDASGLRFDAIVKAA
jgi:hypothetical protein